MSGAPRHPLSGFRATSIFSLAPASTAGYALNHPTFPPGVPTMPHHRLLAVLVLVLGALDAPPAVAGEPLRAAIDRELAAEWKKQKVSPAPRSSDPEFLRRVFIDIVGTVPSLAETTEFLGDKDEKKRENLIEKLLADPRYAKAQADVWDLVLFGRRPGAIDITRTRPTFKTWLAKQFAENVPYDKLTRDLLVAEQPGSEMFLVQFRNSPEEAAVNVSRIFLGMQLQCARCHDHPYDVWTQKDFYGLAGFFVRLVVQEAGSGNARVFSIGEKMAGEVLFSGAAKDQRPGKRGDPVKPRFLGGEELAEPPTPKDFKDPAPKNGQKLPKPTFSRKEKLAGWVTAGDNPYLARAAVNRVWAQFMGRGLVHPVDNFHKENVPSHPALLATMAEGFATNKFDLKWLIREIVNSDAYQLAGTGPVTDALPSFFERARVRPLSAEEIVAAMRAATVFQPNPNDPRNGWDYFLRYFGEPTNGLGDFQGSLSEHLFVNNGEQIRAFTRRKKGNLTDQLLTATDPWEKRVERLFLAVLSRPPKPIELSKFLAFIGTDPKKADARLEDAVWVLLNSSEFRFNH